MMRLMATTTSRGDKKDLGLADPAPYWSTNPLSRQARQGSSRSQLLSTLISFLRHYYYSPKIDLSLSSVFIFNLCRAEASHSSNNMERHTAARWQQRHGASHNGMVEHRTTACQHGDSSNSIM